MHAIQFTKHGGPEVFEYGTCEEDDLETGEVRIETKAIGVNYADLKRRSGSSSSTVTFPCVPGIEAAGIITETLNVDGFSEGDRVVTYVPEGAYAESIVTANEDVYHVPDEISLDVAASIPVQFLTAYQSLLARGNMQASDRVLIHAAAGGVGSAAVQVAALIGAEIFGTASTQDKLEFAQSLGADHGINYTTDNVVTQINQLTGNGGVDLVLDGVGGSVLRDSIEVLGLNGRFISIGSASGADGTPDPSVLRRKNIRFHGYHLGTTRKTDPDSVTSDLDTIFEYIVSDALTVHIDQRFSLQEAGAAHEYIQNRENHGKVLLIP